MSENHTKINYEFLDSAKNFIYEARVHIPQELRIRSGGTERHSASN